MLIVISNSRWPITRWLISPWRARVACRFSFVFLQQKFKLVRHFSQPFLGLLQLLLVLSTRWSFDIIQFFRQLLHLKQAVHHRERSYVHFLSIKSFLKSFSQLLRFLQLQLRLGCFLHAIFLLVLHELVKLPHKNLKFILIIIKIRGKKWKVGGTENDHIKVKSAQTYQLCAMSWFIGSIR